MEHDGGDRPWMPWAMVAAMFVVATFSWGLSFYGLGFYLRELNLRHGWSLTTLSTVTFAFHLTAMVLSFPVSDQLARRGPQPVFLVGAVAGSVAVAAIGYVTSIWQLVAIYLLMAIGWSCLSLNSISTTVLAWHRPDRSGPPLTVALTGASAGGVVIIPTLVALDQRVGLRATLAAAGVAKLIVVGGLGLAVIGRPAGSAPSDRRRQRPAWPILRLPRFWILSAGLGLAIAAQVGFLVHHLSFLTTSIEPSDAARIVALTTACAFAGRLIFVALVRWIEAQTGGLLFLLTQAAALAALSRQSADAGADIATAAILSAVFGLGVGVLITLPPLLTRAHFPHQPFTSTFPLVNVTYGVGVALGAPLTAVLHDRLDGYPAAFAVLALADLAAVGLLGWSDRAAGRRGPPIRTRPGGPPSPSTAGPDPGRERSPDRWAR